MRANGEHSQPFARAGSGETGAVKVGGEEQGEERGEK